MTGEELKWRASNLGMITCLTVGDVKNKGANSLVLITGEGICYTFDHHIQVYMVYYSEKMYTILSMHYNEYTLYSIQYTLYCTHYTL